MRKLSLIGAGLSLALATAAIAGPPSGALHTTTVDGSVVNENHYAAKPDVYITGGPNNKAPGQGPRLDAGWYYFQVTDPSGKVLLSQDPIQLRRFFVNAQGLITQALTHATGVDLDDGDLTVQLWPFADTPNNGNVYKAWITPVQHHRAGQGTHGFQGKHSKTDNFQVLDPDCGCE